MSEIVLTWGNVIAFFSVALSGAGVFSAIVWGVYKQIREVKDELDAHKLEVARNFVSNVHLNGIKEDLIRSEERTLAAIIGLAERFDRFLNRNT